MKAASAMVFRLGVGGTKGKTRFALAQVDDVKDFFLFGAESEQGAETFLSPAPLRSLFGYSIIRPGEKTLVNLAFASGLLAFALRLDSAEPLPAPATGAFTADFRFRPHSGIDVELDHRAGQVEVDAVFVGRRDGRETVFVVEAKTDSPPLAKHKLVYPVLGLMSRIPTDIPVVPVYLRAWASTGGFNFLIGECDLPDPRIAHPSVLSELSIRSVRHLRLPLLGAE